MSFRNGDKSREHRLRKAKQKKREVARCLSTSDPKLESSVDSSAKK